MNLSTNNALRLNGLLPGKILIGNSLPVTRNWRQRTRASSIWRTRLWIYERSFRGNSLWVHNAYIVLKQSQKIKFAGPLSTVDNIRQGWYDELFYGFIGTQPNYVSQRKRTTKPAFGEKPPYPIGSKLHPERGRYLRSRGLEKMVGKTKLTGWHYCR